jgi:hypothetical protein
VSEPTSNVYERLHLARDAFPDIYRNKDNPFFSSRYATLGHILDKVEPVLREHGLMIVQYVSGQMLVTELTIVDGDAELGVSSLVSLYPLPQVDNPQKMGSAITYARRYAIGTLLGLAIEKDDDGEAAAGRVNHAESVSEPEEAPELPEGWSSHSEASAAHTALSQRVVGLSPEKKAPVKAFRSQHGWPMSKGAFDELSGLVAALEMTEIVEGADGEGTF